MKSIEIPGKFQPEFQLESQHFFYVISPMSRPEHESPQALEVSVAAPGPADSTPCELGTVENPGTKS